MSVDLGSIRYAILVVTFCVLAISGVSACDDCLKNGEICNDDDDCCSEVCGFVYPYENGFCIKLKEESDAGQ